MIKHKLTTSLPAFALGAGDGKYSLSDFSLGSPRVKVDKYKKRPENKVQYVVDEKGNIRRADKSNKKEEKQ